MVANLGYGALLITFLVSIYAAYRGCVWGAAQCPSLGGKRAQRNAAHLSTADHCHPCASSILLVNGNYEVEYVASVTSNSMPLYLRVTALWGGQAGSLVFWSWLMSAFASAVTLRKWDRDREFLPWVILVSMVTLAFFLMLTLFVENPFERIWMSPTGAVTTSMFQPAGTTLFTPQDGQGLNPLLRHPGMIIHPPMLYLGFVSFVIPYAFAIAALVTGRTDDRWIRITRRWTLVAWLFLSLGLILGVRWAYDVLGWGGYWGWDPVEISALHALAERHRLPALGGDPGEARHAQALEHGADHPDLRPGDLRHLPDPLRGAFLGACLCAKRHRTAVLRLSLPSPLWPRWHCWPSAGTS